MATFDTTCLDISVSLADLLHEGARDELDHKLISKLPDDPALSRRLAVALHGVADVVDNVADHLERAAACPPDAYARFVAAAKAAAKAGGPLVA